jgi:DNA replication licensing factor MCM3
MISEHVLRMHRYLQPGLEEGTPALDVMEQNLSVGADTTEESVSRLETAVFEKYNALLHGGVTTTTGRGANKKKEVLSIAFIKKYIQYAKNRCKPALTKEAADYIVAVYTSLRNDDLASNQKRVSQQLTHLRLYELMIYAIYRLPLLLPVHLRLLSVCLLHMPKHVFLQVSAKTTR